MNSELIFSYSRAQAIADGVLIDLTAVSPEVCREHYRVPIACTAAVWSIINKAINDPRWANDLDGVMSDLLWLSRKASKALDASTVEFSAIITGTGRRRLHRFWLVVGPGDEAEPVGTLMLQGED